MSSNLSIDELKNRIERIIIQCPQVKLHPLQQSIQAVAAWTLDTQVLPVVLNVFSDHVLEIATHVLQLDQVYVWKEKNYRAVQNSMEKREWIAWVVAEFTFKTPTLVSMVRQRLSTGPCFFDYVLGEVSDVERTRRIATTAFRLITVSPESFRKLWNWTSFLKLCTSVDTETRWYAARTVSLLSEMPQASHDVFLTELKVQSTLCNNNDNSDCVAIEIQEYQHNLLSQMKHETNSMDTCDDEVVPLHRDLVNVFGIIAHKDPSSRIECTLKWTATTRRNLHELALACGTNRPVLVDGESGSGKTSLIRELSALVGAKDVVELYFDEQMDSKTLFGTYVCSDIPGEFLWQPGVLTQALQDGRWVVIEDVDKCPFEIVAALTPLLEGRSVLIPALGRVIEAADGFRMFGTRTITDGGIVSAAGFQESLWCRVNIQPQDQRDIEMIIEETVGNLPVEAKVCILRTFMAFLSSQQQTQVLGADFYAFIKRSARRYSLRDLVKWCNRITQHSHLAIQTDFLSESYRYTILHEAIDIFCSWIPSETLRASVACRAGELCGLTHDSVQTKLQNHAPMLRLSSINCSIGRFELNRLPSDMIASSKSSSFAMTNQALRLLERIAGGVVAKEPVLLVGETGCGKTTVIQQLATACGASLVVQNLNIQSDSTDLLGGYKPVSIEQYARPIYSRFVALFSKTFSRKQNSSFLEQIRAAYEQKNWKKMAKGMQKAVRFMDKKTEPSLKSRKTTSCDGTTGRVEWEELKTSIQTFSRNREKLENSFAFAFVEGILVKALKEGQWIMLDEINLASSDTLERITSILDSHVGTVSMTERGDMHKVVRHPNFRLFAAMNPPNDVGKKDLPISIRSRFTEIFVDEVTSNSDLQLITSQYFSDVPSLPVGKVVEFYKECRRLAEETLVEGSGQRPRYSLRTLCRALQSCRCFLDRGYGLELSLYKGFIMNFAMQLEHKSFVGMESTIKNTFAKTLKSAEMTKAPPRRNRRSEDPNDRVLVSSCWLQAGPLERKDQAIPDPRTQKKQFVLTKSVETYLDHIARAALVAKYPVLLQGPTSAGKTSLVFYLANRIGQKCVRINNHEHTDIQEYIGSYVTDSDGRLQFVEGVLVQAVREGWWVVLDELNLAPSDVLEALNRLLDDNRELLISETQQVIKPHPNFMLFATQNPPGIYGGRKVLSRAFRNRFLEIQIDEIPMNELETIVQERCAIPPSYCSILVHVMKDLQMQRQQSSVFQGKGGFITTRDLLRWAGRNPSSKQELAEHGYCLLAERLRNPMEKETVKRVLEKHCGVKIQVDQMYEDCSVDKTTTQQLDLVRQSIQEKNGEGGIHHIAATKSLKRLFALVGRCLRNKEPILLVGETGCGKTTVCQLYSILFQQQLRIVNCHQHTETSDLLGSFRPVRGKENLLKEITRLIVDFYTQNDISPPHPIESATEKQILFMCDEIVARDSQQIEIQKAKGQYVALFEWQDGPLVSSMRDGDLILLDEVNLAEDAVLERLNSVLEPSRTLLLAEKGGETADEIIAADPWRIFATMNPGGDFGKRELSPALRNRFTEIWVPAIDDLEDYRTIALDRIIGRPLLPQVDAALVFLQWCRSISSATAFSVTVRDVLAWIDFIKSSDDLSVWMNYVHGAAMVLLDGISLQSGLSKETVESVRRSAYEFLVSQIPQDVRDSVYQSIEGKLNDCKGTVLDLVGPENTFGIAPFFIPRGPVTSPDQLPFSVEAPTTRQNLTRVLRALQLPKPILLEGSPGVGKTSVISALAAASGNSLVRINLSEQTDISDLFGTDLPVPQSADEPEGEPRFAWCDGAFLQALRAGSWVLLDELNLAPQSVLEGLNACLDHRATIYIPEIGKEFECPKTFRVFAAQNPLHQGGGRKGLPRSFLNRFTRVYVETLDLVDYRSIGNALYPNLAATEDCLLHKMIDFNCKMEQAVTVERKFGYKGSPWEFNLRDVFRWCDLVQANSTQPTIQHVLKYAQVIFAQRMRSKADQEAVLQILKECFGDFEMEDGSSRGIYVDTSTVTIGQANMKRKDADCSRFHSLPVFDGLMTTLESVMYAVQMKWPCLLTGNSATGKTLAIRTLAALTGNHLVEIPMTCSVDASELLGCFEQTNRANVLQQLIQTLDQALQSLSESSNLNQLQKIFNMRWTVHSLSTKDNGLKARVESILQGIEEFDHELNDLLTLARVLTTRISLDGSVGMSGNFVWVDGPLIHAMESGDWVLLDNVNFCSSSVLDRLNSVLEKNGQLTVNECGSVDGKLRIVQPHEEFRVFFAMDPIHGEVSRAMRNRCIEICINEESLDPSTLQLDGLVLLNSAGITGFTYPKIMYDIYSSAQESKIDISKRHLFNWATSVATQIAHGLDIQQAIHHGFENAFGRTLDSTVFQNLGLILMQRLSNVEPQLYLPTVSPNYRSVEFLITNKEERDVKLQAALVESLLLQPTSRIEALNSIMMSAEDSDLGFILNNTTDVLDCIEKLIGQEPSAEQIHHYLTLMAVKHFSLLNKRNASGLKWLQTIISAITSSSTPPVVQYWHFIDSIQHDLILQPSFFLFREHLHLEQINKENRTFIQQSKLCFTGKCDVVECVNELVPLLYPYFIYFDTWISDVLQLSSSVDPQIFRPMMDGRLNLFTSVMTRCTGPFPWEAFLVLWKSFQKSIVRFQKETEMMLVESYQPYEQVLTRLSRCLTKLVRFSGAGDRLWKRGGHLLLPQSQSLWSVVDELRQLACTFDIRRSELQHKLCFMDMVTSTHPIMFVDSSIKTELLQALCTLHANNRNRSNAWNTNDVEWNQVSQMISKRVVDAQTSFSTESESLSLTLRLFDDSDWESEGSTRRVFTAIGRSPVFDKWSCLRLSPVIEPSILRRESVLLCKMLTILNQNDGNLQSFATELKVLIRDVIETTSRNPADLVPYQDIIWMIQSDENFTCEHLNTLFLQHQQRVWQNVSQQVVAMDLDNSEMEFRQQDDVCGSLDLVLAIQTKSTLDLLSDMRVKSDGIACRLQQVEMIKTQLDSLLRHLRQHAPIDIYSHLIEQQKQMLWATLLAYRSFFESTDLDDPCQLVESCQDERLKSCLETLIRPLVAILYSTDPEIQDEIAIGNGYMYLGLLRLTLLLPSTPVDPVVKPMIKRACIQRSVAHLQLNASIRSYSETIDSSERKDQRKQDTIEYETASVKIEQLSKQSIERPMERPNYSELFEEIHRFADSVATHDRLMKLMHSLQHDQAPKVLKSIDEARMWQDMSQRFILHFQSKFDAYRDIVEPLLVSIYLIKDGLGAMLRFAQSRSCDFQVMDTLLSFPSASHPLEFAQIVSRSDTSDRLGFLRTALLRVHVYSRTNDTLCPRLLSVCREIFDQYTDIWSEIEAERERREAQENELFKYKERATDMEEEDVENEKEYQALFPDFTQEFENTGNDMEMKVETKAPAMIPDEMVHFIAESYLSLFIRDKSQDKFIESVVKSFDNARFVESQRSDVDVDRKAVGTLALTVALTLKSLKENVEIAENEKQVFHFHLDPNPKEVIRAQKPLMEVLRKIKVLLQQWPENAVLQSLVDRIDAITRLDIQCPLGKMLTAIECFLRSAQQWEESAPRIYSLDEYLKSLSSLVVRWRKLELQSWPQLLQDKDRQAQLNAERSWLHLYKLLTATQVESSDWLAQLFENLDLYVRSSNLGQFETRLKLIYAFCMHLHYEIELQPTEKDKKEPLRNLLYHIYRFYAQHAELVALRLKQLRDPIEKKLLEHVKICRWDEQSYYSLKEAAEKSHRKLFKYVKDYEQVLMVPLQSILDEAVDGKVLNGNGLAVTLDHCAREPTCPERQVDTKDLSPIILRQSFRSDPEILKLVENSVADWDNLQCILRMNKLTHKIRTQLKENPIRTAFDASNSCEDLCDALFSRQKQLQAPETGIGPKKKALSDLLHHLKQEEISVLRAHLPAEEQRMEGLFQSPIPCLSYYLNQVPEMSTSLALWKRADGYFFKLLSQLPLLRFTSVSGYSKDLSSGEVNRMIGYMENLQHMVLSQRRLLDSCALNQSRLLNCLSRLDTPAVNETLSVLQPLEELELVQRMVAELQLLFQELNHETNVVDRWQERITTSIQTVLQSNTRLFDSVPDGYKDSTSGFVVAAHVVRSMLPISSEETLILSDMAQESELLLHQVSDQVIVCALEQFNRQLASLTRIEKVEKINPTPNDGMVNEFSVAYSSVVHSILRLVQKYIGFGDQSEQEWTIGGLQNAYSDLSGLFEFSTILKGISKLQTIQQEAPSTLRSYFQDLILDLKPSLMYLKETSGEILMELIPYHKSFVKMTYVLSRVFRTLFVEGFCVTGEEKEAEGDGNFQDDVEGTGMGQGEGKKDVSDQIEDEEQILGLRGEEEDEREVPEDQEDNGLEMSNDFEGTMHDIPEEDQKEEEKEDDDEREELDREMGNFDEEEENVVDEKMWGDDSDDKDDKIDKENEKFEKDAAIEDTAANDDEIRGKDEDEEDQEDQNDEKKKNKETAQEFQDDKEEEEEPFINEDDESKYEESHEPVSKQEEEEDDENAAAGFDEDDIKCDDDDEEEGDEGDAEEGDEGEGNEDDQEDVQEQTTGADFEQEEEEEEENPVDEMDQMDVNGGNGMIEEEEEEEEENGPENPNDENDKTSTETTEQDSSAAAFGESMDDGGQATVETEMEDAIDEKNTDGKPTTEHTQAKPDTGDEQSGSENKITYDTTGSDSQSPEQRQEQSQAPNPYREPDNTTKHWRRRLNVIEPQEVDNNEQDSKTTQDRMDDESATLEHDQTVTASDDQDSFQTLAPTDETSTEPINLQEEEEEDVEAPEALEDVGRKEEESKPELVKMEDSKTSCAPKTDETSAAVTHQTPIEPEMKQEKEKKEKTIVEERETSLSSHFVTNASEWNDSIELKTLSEMERMKLRQDLNASLNLNKTTLDIALNERRWAQYVGLTCDASQRLCEQLRLVLEPTLRSKLQGDFRTGKRINMRKIIPYIASQFRKDKIWMRRTKPSKRQYQVMIAIDDSESMADNNAGQLALEAMCTLCKGMTQLELGDLSVLKFGELCQLLHPFNRPFTDQAGAEIVSNFSFDQQQTDLIHTMRSITSLLEDTKQPNSNVEYTQLVFLISDARFDKNGRQKIDQIVRDATEKRQLFVLVIVDSQDPNQSILATKSVSFRKGKVEMEAYLENFPFPYYVILQNAKALPEVLSDALRQWFEMLSNN